MKSLLTITSAAIILSGCVTQRKCLEKFPPTVTIDSVITRTVTVTERDTVFAGDTVRIEFPVLKWADCDSIKAALLALQAKPARLVSPRSGLAVEVGIDEDGNLWAECVEAEKKAKLYDRWAEVVKRYNRSEIHHVQPRWWNRFAVGFWLGVAVVSAFVILIVFVGNRLGRLV
jgi:hypothetical protein